MSSTQLSIHPLIADVLRRHRLDRFLLLDLHFDGEGVVHDLGPDHPLPHLLGRAAPPGCIGSAVVSPGEITFSDHPASWLGVGESVQVAEVVMADGRSRCFVAGARGPAPSGFACHHSAGLVPDAMRRAFGLPTPPPDRAVSWYWAVVWIAEVLHLDTDAGARQIASWHPAIDPRELADLADDQIVEMVVGRHLDHARATGWEGLRRSASDGWLDVGGCPADLAEWFDAGSFCRWLSGQLPGPFELLETVAARFGPAGRRLISPVLLEAVGAGGRRSTDSGPT